MRLSWLHRLRQNSGLEKPRGSPVRQTAELIVMLCLSVIVVRTFSAEAYVVPTGSMAPTLLGWHRELVCPSCESVFVVGIEDEGQTGEAICPNCGKSGLDDGPSIECGGDRVLVEKFIYEFRRPRRWEVAVFHFPGEPSQAYVKRVVGLPGELIRIKEGDVFINDRIARKSLAEIRAMRMLVHDSRFRPQNADRVPAGSSSPILRSRPPPPAGHWKAASSSIQPKATQPLRRTTTGWSTGTGIPAHGGYGTITDFHGYNGSEPRQLNEIKDVGMEARVTLSQSVDRVSLALRSEFDRFELRIDTRPRRRRSAPSQRPSRPDSQSLQPVRRPQNATGHRASRGGGHGRAVPGRHRRAPAVRALRLRRPAPKRPVQ